MKGRVSEANNSKKKKKVPFSFSIRRRSSSLCLCLARLSWSWAFFLAPLYAVGRSIVDESRGRELLCFLCVCVCVCAGLCVNGCERFVECKSCCVEIANLFARVDPFMYNVNCGRELSKLRACDCSFRSGPYSPLLKKE